MSGIRLIASSDDFLLEQAIAETVDELRSKTPEAEVETLPDDVGPEALAVEMSSPLCSPPSGSWF
jgi:lipoate synthase